MSGHSKWASIKHKKSKEDAKRGKLFSKLIKEIIVAARMGGGDPQGNPRLRNVIERAKEANMPQENIERAIKKGTGELPGESYEECTFEGYGPGGVAILIEATTDNRKRTASEIRHILSKHGGNLGEAGCVSWIFSKRGLITIDANKIDEDKLLDISLEAGADDVRRVEDTYEIITSVNNFEKVRSALAAHNISYNSAEITFIPQTTIKLEGKEAEQMLRLMDALEEHDDIQHIYANFDIPTEIMEQVAT